MGIHFFLLVSKHSLPVMQRVHNNYFTGYIECAWFFSFEWNDSQQNLLCMLVFINVYLAYISELK